jgi:hypothetical protein
MLVHVRMVGVYLAKSLATAILWLIHADAVNLDNRGYRRQGSLGDWMSFAAACGLASVLMLCRRTGIAVYPATAYATK